MKDIPLNKAILLFIIAISIYIVQFLFLMTTEAIPYPWGLSPYLYDSLTLSMLICIILCVARYCNTLQSRKVSMRNILKGLLVAAVTLLPLPIEVYIWTPIAFPQQLSTSTPWLSNQETMIIDIVLIAVLLVVLRRVKTTNEN